MAVNGTPIGDFIYKQVLVRINEILLEMRDDLNQTGLAVQSPFEVSDDDINKLYDDEEDDI